MALRLTVHNLSRDVRLVRSGRIADNVARRVIGLLLERELAQGGGLWIVPCNSIHSMGMRFVFDALFLDKDLRVVHLMQEMKPWRVSKMIFAAKSVLELPPGLIAESGTAVGDQLEMQKENFPSPPK
jgi:uncharacterized membrane protein (UPF0127 family)